EQALEWKAGDSRVRQLYATAFERAQAADPEPPVPHAGDRGGDRAQVEGPRLPGAKQPAPHSNGPSNTAQEQSIPQIALVARNQEAGLEFQYFNGESGFKYILESTGGGVAVLDYDADGWPDLYFPQGCRIPVVADDETCRDRLFRNLGNGAFA